MAKLPRPRAGSIDRRSPLQALVGPGDAQAPTGTAIVAVSPPSPHRPPSDAVSVFEKGMRALQRHAFADAADQFRAVLASFPKEGGLCDRSQVYLSLCERELRQRPAPPRTIEERVVAATAALNDGDDAQAEVFAKGVLTEVPRHDLALYLLAAVEARRGSTDAALSLLSQSLDVNPEIRAQARHDADFEDLRDLESFRQLIDPPVDQGTLASRRGRRGRVER